MTKLKLKFMWLVAEYIMKTCKDKSLIKLSGDVQREIEDKLEEVK